MKQRHLVLTAVLATFFAAGLGGMAEAKKKPGSSSSPPTAEQRKKMWKDGYAQCRKQHGANLARVTIQNYYGRWTAVCWYW